MRAFMTGSELQAARTRLGLSAAEMAAELGLTPGAYSVLEADPGRRVPTRYAEDVAFRVSCREQEEALAASGLPECASMQQMLETQATLSPEKQLEQAERAQRHAAACPTCQARDQFLQQRFPNAPPPPLPGWMRVLGAFSSWVDRRPAWLRPAVWGAAALVAMTSIRLVFALPAAVRDPGRLATLLGALLLAAVAGAFAGLVYELAGRPLRRVKGVGPYLAGVVTVAGYLLAIGALLTAGGLRDFTESPGAALV